MRPKYLLGIFVMYFSASMSFAASENLEEIHIRKARLSTNSWGKTYVEDPRTLVWQPETLAYNDVETGAEVWRLSSTNGVKNSLPDISWAQWSADGKRFSFGSHRDTSANTSSYETSGNATYQGTVMLMRADGSYLRPADNAPFEVYVHSRYLHWSPVEPDVYYGFGRNFASEGLASDQLYKVTVSDVSIDKQMVLDLETGAEVSMKKAISSDGTKLLVSCLGKYYPITLLPSVFVENAHGWSMARRLDGYWGNTPENGSFKLHDAFLVGTGGKTQLYFIPAGYSSWWKMNLSGSGKDGGPEHLPDHVAPYTWGEIEPVLTGYSSGGKCGVSFRSPWNCDDDPGTGPDQYLSHPGFDRWGRYVAGMNSQQYKGFAVWDLWNHFWFAKNIPAPHYDWHNDWEAWSDYFLSSPSGSFAVTDNIFVHKYDGSDSISVASTHAREAGSSEYNALPRGTQSPDGTKIVFHSDFLYNSANVWDVFYAVAYYPHPPEITSVIGDGTYAVRFDWRTEQGTSRGYTLRGWPDEERNDPPPPRETKAFRLWRSFQGSQWTPVATMDANIFRRYDFRSGRWIGEKDWTFYDTPGEGKFHYGVTAVEHSGLESRTLSNIVDSTGKRVGAYPDHPKKKSSFYTQLPPAPKFSVEKLDIPGQYRLDWNEPQSSVIRYYNIYYSSTASPKALQENRIASVPVGHGTYLDWLADIESEGYYLVTSVDSQGNESAY